jgi:signal transduction histidine kinase
VQRRLIVISRVNGSAMKLNEPKHMTRWVALQAGIALTYFWLGKLGLGLAFTNTYVTPVWAPTGLALGAVLVFGYRVWPAIVLGLVGLTAWGPTTLPWPAIISVASGNVLEALAGAWLLRTITGQSNPLYDARTFLWFLAVGVFACPAISATVGVVSLCASGVANWDSVRELWLIWWLGDATGSLLVAPFIVAALTAEFTWLPRRKVIEGAVVAVALSLICYFVFLEPHSIEQRRFPQSLLLMPALAWAAFHFTALGTSGAVLLVSIAGVWGTVNGLGPYALGDTTASLIVTQASFGLIAGTVLLLSALRAQQQRDEQQLKCDQELLRRLIELQEQDRRMVAHEIHDGIVQDVVGVHLLVQSIPCALGPNADESSVNRIIGLLRKAINEGRRLIREMRPMVLDEQGVIEAIQHLIADFEEHAGLVIAFDHDVQFGRLDARLEGVIFRIVQESLNNVEKHAKTTYAAVRLIQHEDRLELVVRDHGTGFDLAKVPQDRFGLRGMRERTRLMGGIAKIESKPSRGTIVSAQFPIGAHHKTLLDREK